MNLIEKIQRHGIAGSVKKVLNKIKTKSGYTKWNFRQAPVYANPTAAELAQIEQGLLALGVELHDYAPPRRIPCLSGPRLVSTGLSRRLEFRCVG